MLKCRICGKETTQINAAHLKIHGLTSSQYREMFPNDKMREVSEKTRIAGTQNLINRNKSKKGRETSSLNMKDKPKTEEHKQKLKEAKQKEDKILRAEINGNNRRGKKHSKETIERIAKNSVKSKKGIRPDIGHFTRSTWEANYIRILKYLKIDYEFEPDVFWLTKDDGSQTSYLPDIKLNKKMYVEVKGYWREVSKEKFELFKQQYPDIKIITVERAEYDRLRKYYKDKINEWE